MFPRRCIFACLLLAGASAPLAWAQNAPPPDSPNVPPPPSAPAGPAPAGPAWLERGTADVQALDKVNARSSMLHVKVGASAQYGSLTIEVQSCVVRPPNVPQDAAAFLVITDAHEGEPGFRGWMFASDPSVSMLEHPVYDVRVTGCQS